MITYMKEKYNIFKKLWNANNNNFNFLQMNNKMGSWCKGKEYALIKKSTR
jgi:hypothetical protein